MHYAEFPHVVEVRKSAKVSDGAGGFKTDWVLVEELDAFIDTPTSKELYFAQQLNNPLNRYMYYPYGTAIDAKHRIYYGDETYELTGKPEDQGGMNEVMRVALKLVTT